MKILITGGAGFVGSWMALEYRQAFPQANIVVLDNLKRRGSEINLEVFRSKSINFIHGDIRSKEDFEQLPGEFDIFIEASAEASVTAGLNPASSSAAYLLNTNLMGTLNALEYAKNKTGFFVFLSTSRVYSIDPLRNLAFNSNGTRLDLKSNQTILGANEKGISETFPVNEWRSLYGASKLSSEYFVQEYSKSFGLKSVINRCGVLSGPGQFGKADQGVYSLWLINHFRQLPLKYTGFGARGEQVRDLMHPKDLFNLIEKQRLGFKTSGNIYNVGGGIKGSVSLREWTDICKEVSKKNISITSDETTHPVDVPYYVSDNSKVSKEFNWEPTISPTQIAEETWKWLEIYEKRMPK